MDAIAQIPWQLILPTSVAIVGLIFAFGLLLSKYPAGRWLGLLVMTYPLILIAVSFPLLKWSVLALFSITLSVYVKVFFTQKTRISYLPWMAIAATSIALLLPFEVGGTISGLIALFYLYQLVRSIRLETHQRSIRWYSNPGARLVWLRNFLLFNAFCLVGYLLGWPNAWILGFVWIIGAYLLIFSQLTLESDFIAPLPVANKYSKSTLSPEIKYSIVGKIKQVFEVEAFYLRDDASLDHLAIELKVTRHHLSQVLNETLQTSFQDLLTKYRIRRASQLLKDKKHQNEKIESIATLVGYNSKSAFNTAFKKRTGYTPSEYRRSKDVLTYREDLLPHLMDTKIQDRSLSLNHVFKSQIPKDMITHFFKFFTQYIRRNRLFSALNLVGLTISFTCSTLIYLFIQDEQSYDQAIPDSDQLYRIVWMNDNPQTRTPHPMAQAMVNDFPEVEEAVSISPWYGPGLSRENVKVKNVEKNIFYDEPDFFFADSTFFKIFDLEWIEGDSLALYQPYSLVITQPFAKKYFGEESAIGKELEIYDMPITVTAVVAPMPENAHFHFNAIMPYVTLKQINPNDTWMSWADFGHFNYIKLKPEVDHQAVEEKIPDWVLSYLNWDPTNQEALRSGQIKFELQPITSIHLTSNLRWELESNGNILYVYILSFTMAFLLIIAGINYINLTTAKSVERAKEVGVRKTLGAISTHLSFQFYLESVVFTLLALGCSFIFALLFMEEFNQLSGKQFDFNELFQTSFLIRAITLCLMIGLIAGVYPAFTLASFKPTEVLKGKLSTSSKGVRLRSVLVVFQFGISAILICGSLIIYRQIEFMKKKDLGFNQEAVISLKIPSSVAYGGINLNKVKAVQKQLDQLAGVRGTSMVSNLPGGLFNQHAVSTKSNPEVLLDVSEMMVDYGFNDVLGIDVVAGRAFDISYPSDTTQLSFMVNEQLVQQLNLTEPIGERMVWYGNDTSLEATIVGVVEDFHYKSLHQKIQPMIMIASPIDANHLIIKLNGKSSIQTIAEVEPIYQQLGNDLSFEYQFLDSQLASLYKQEEKTLTIFSTFSLVALILASLGLLGMAIATMNQRVKEVGMRKILGASSLQIMLLVSRQFLQLILIALIVGLPVAYILMQSWLVEFSYRTSYGIMPFILTVLILLGVSLLSVFSAVMKITFANPVNALRSE